MRKGTKLYSIIKFKCPSCHEGNFFISHPYNFKNTGDVLDKWRAFGWDVSEVDGHSIDQIQSSISTRETCKVIIANTTKGKGVSFMENTIKWHYKSPDSEELALALEEVKQVQK